jgi:acid stress-induced BolA-like protein IbaG/YrbA
MIKPGPPVVTNTDEGSLICPKCGGYTTHVDHVQVAARGDDQTFDEIYVNAETSEVRTHRHVKAPVGTFVGEGRRHRIALSGFCEECGAQFSLVFTQHKGDTVIEWAEPTIDADPRG